MSSFEKKQTDEVPKKTPLKIDPVVEQPKFL